MKRLLCLISGMNTGGAETFLMKIYRKIDKSKYQMDFCVNMKEPGFYDNEIKNMGGRMFVIPSKSEDLKGFKSGLKEIIKANNYKYVIRITSNAAGFMDLKVAKKAGAEVCIARSSNSNDGEGIWAIIAHKIGRLLYQKYVDVRIAPSDLAAKYTFGEKAFSKGEVMLLNNAIDLNLYQYSDIGRRKIRSELGISDFASVYGHIGRFSKQKNHSFLIDIFHEIHKSDEEAKLILVGDGELEKSIREKIHQLEMDSDVFFLGIRKDIPELLSAMDVFVFPSLYEGMPNTVIEAQATGLPCLVSNTITHEADVAELVHFLDLNVSEEVWAEYAQKLKNNSRSDTMKLMSEKGYDIQSSVKQFVSLVFKE